MVISPRFLSSRLPLPDLEELKLGALALDSMKKLNRQVAKSAKEDL
jgi:hypothetical protein